MIEIIAGTDRPNSNSSKVAQILLEDYVALGVKADIIDLSRMNFGDLVGAGYKGPQGEFVSAVERVTRAEGLVVVVPEYNGSYPGALKLFIDYWRYPDTFEGRPVAFVGIGGRWGGLRPVEHLQQALGYRNAFIFPHRVFIHQVHHTVKDGKIHDQMVCDLLKTQSRDFLKYIKALKGEKLDANSRLKK